MSWSEKGSENCPAHGTLWGMTAHARVVTFIGAGGKTTCLRSITQEIATTGQPVISSTTTKVFPEESIRGWQNTNPPYKQKGAIFWYIKVLEESGKWIGPSVNTIDDAIAKAPDRQCYWVIEGDGARGLKLKCWDSHEPQIPLQSDCVVLAVDGGLWGNILQAEQVHRPTHCPDLIGHVWNAESAWRYFLRSPVFSQQYDHMAWVILLNSKGMRNTILLLDALSHRWNEIRQEDNMIRHRPNHLRLAAGDAKGGELLWLDLW